MSKHTPGPWRYKPHSVDSNYMLIFCSNDPHEGDNLRGYCGEDNARLIAAAPMMYEALKAAEPYLRHANVAYNVYVQARAAIAEAEGA